MPVDHDPAPPAVLDFFAATGAVPIAMSRFGQERLRGFDPLYVPHGVATDVYRPQPRAEVTRRGGIPRDAFVVGIVAVNKGAPSRKSLAEMIEAFAIFRARHDDAILYLHTELQGQHQGTHLPSLLDELGVPEEAVLVVDQSRYLFHPFTPEEMAATYSSLDVLMNASMGEGFGLTVLEAQACGVPAIVTDFTAMSEVCGAGWKVGYERHWTDQASWQARPHVEEIVESLEECYALDEQSRRELSARAREHALAYDADRVLAEHWLPALEEVALRLPGLAPPLRGPSRERCRSRRCSGTRGSAIAPSCVPVLMMSRRGCASVISLADDVEQEPARRSARRPTASPGPEAPRRRGRSRPGPAGTGSPTPGSCTTQRRVALTARAGSRARSAGPCPGCCCRS